MYDELKAFTLASGPTAFGVSHIEDLRPHFDALPMDQTEGLSYAISIGGSVSAAVICTITEWSTGCSIRPLQSLRA